MKFPYLIINNNEPQRHEIIKIKLFVNNLACFTAYLANAFYEYL